MDDACEAGARRRAIFVVSGLFVAKCVDRVEAGGAAGRETAEDHADQLHALKWSRTRIGDDDETVNRETAAMIGGIADEWNKKWGRI